jgi:hypothetical protein
VSEEKRFRIQRADGQWYEGRGTDHSPTWTTEEAGAYGFVRQDVAAGVVRWLTYLGFAVEVVEATR